MKKSIFSPDCYLPGHALELLPGGEPYFSRLLRLVGEAKRTIHFQVYIFEEDDTGREVAEALKQASRRGVEIFLTVDSYGSRGLSAGFVADLESSGIRFKKFSPLPRFYNFRVGRRLHNKVVVADSTVALVGGINVADKYRGSVGEPPWLDFALWVRGPLCAELARLCERISRDRYFGKLKPRTTATKSLAAGTARSRIAVNDWFRRKHQITSGYRDAFQEASQSIVIMASYFLPGPSTRRALRMAAKRGVRVTLFLAGKSDVPMSFRATRFLYFWFLKNDIQVCEWHESVLHAKLAIVDSKWVSVGSYNLNHISRYSSIETNVEVLDQAFATATSAHLVTLLQSATPVSAESFGRSRSTWDKLGDWVAYGMARWAMRLLFFLVWRQNAYERVQ